MKTHLSSKGQVVIPREVRDLLRWKEGAELEVDVEEGRVILRKAVRPVAWRAWQGKFKGIDLTKALKEEHRAEAARDRRKGP